MNGRTPTVYEGRYIRICKSMVGCIPCRLDGDSMLDPNEEWIAFHHDPDYGSVKPECHLHGYGMCIRHHQGINAPEWMVVRHRNEARFIEKYGRDEPLCKASWAFIKAFIVAGQVLDATIFDYCPFEELSLAA